MRATHTLVKGRDVSSAHQGPVACVLAQAALSRPDAPAASPPPTGEKAALVPGEALRGPPPSYQQPQLPQPRGRALAPTGSCLQPGVWVGCDGQQQLHDMNGSTWNQRTEGVGTTIPWLF